MTVQSFKKSQNQPDTGNANRIVVFTPDSRSGGPPLGKWEYEEVDGTILMYREDPLELIMIVLDEDSVLQEQESAENQAEGRDHESNCRHVASPLSPPLPRRTRPNE